jgi:aspartate kinase
LVGFLGGALGGGACGPAEVQIWTDVDGILTADPRLVAGARRVSALSFAEALELACSGSKKPHPGTLEAAARGGVPIRILNSLTAGGPGTLIGRRAEPGPGSSGTIKSLACRPNDCLLHVFPGAAADPDFRARVTGVVERLRPALLVLRLDAQGAQLALDSGDRLPEVRAALRAAGAMGEVGVVHGRAVVSLVSEDLAGDGALLARALAAAADLQPRLVVAGAAAPVVRCLVELEDLAAAVVTLHDRIFATAGLA